MGYSSIEMTSQVPMTANAHVCCVQHGIDNDHMFDVGIFFAMFSLVILQLVFSCFADVPPLQSAGKVCSDVMAIDVLVPY